MNNRKLHILIIPSWYPEFFGDYVGSFFKEQALGIYKQKCKVGVVYPELKSLRGLKKIRIIPKLKISDDEGLITYKYLWSNWLIKQKKLQILAFKILGHKLFKKYIKENGKPDIIHCQSLFNAGFLSEYIFDKYDIPFIITEHNSGFYYNDQGFENYFEDVKRILKKSSRCFAVSKYYSEYLTNLFQNEVEWDVHHNIVSNQFLSTPLTPNNKQKFKFICISRFSKIKNFPLLINSFKKFNEIVPDSKLKIIGVGSEKKNIEKLVSNYGLDKKVQFLGRKLRNEVINEVNLSNALVYASSFETFGVIFVEALSLGKPVVTTNCGSAVEILNHKVGIISKENNENSLFKSMLQLYNNYGNYDPKYIRSYCEEKFSEKKLSVKIINHYKEVLNN